MHEGRGIFNGKTWIVALVAIICLTLLGALQVLVFSYVLVAGAGGDMAKIGVGGSVWTVYKAISYVFEKLVDRTSK